MSAALTAIALVLSSPTVEEKTAQLHVRSAEAHAARGRFAEAGVEYLTAFTWRWTPETLLEAAHAFARAGRTARADCLYRRYLTLYPTGDSAARARGEIARFGGACPVLP